MSRVTLVRYTTKPEKAGENEALSRAVFEELRRTTPRGVVYALFRDGVDFVHLFVNLEGDTADPVTELASFKAFLAGAADRYVAAPETVRLDVTLRESYGLDRLLAHA